MKIERIVMLIFLLAFASACSNNKKTDGEVAEAESSVVESEDSDFIVDAEEGEEELLVDENGEEPVDMNAEEQKEETIVAESEAPVESHSAPVIQGTGNFGTYQVKKGDTLMLVAFKIYGDYARWKELASHNPGVGQTLVAGTQLKFEEPAEKFVWQPGGLPHLIVEGETLGSISNDKYGTDKRWKEIFDHNRPMIKQPDLIFAGFTLYYMPNERDVASE